MTIKYCPTCKTLGKTKVDPSGYKQILYQNNVIKRRKVIHRIEDGGCGKMLKNIRSKASRFKNKAKRRKK